MEVEMNSIPRNIIAWISPIVALLVGALVVYMVLNPMNRDDVTAVVSEKAQQQRTITDHTSQMIRSWTERNGSEDK